MGSTSSQHEAGEILHRWLIVYNINTYKRIYVLVGIKLPCGMDIMDCGLLFLHGINEDSVIKVLYTTCDRVE